MSFIPDLGHPFRLTSAVPDKNYLLSHSGDDLGRRAIPKTYDIRDGTWWVLKRSWKPVADLYQIAPFESESRLFYNCDRNEAGIYDGHQSDDQLWFVKFDPHDDTKFQLINCYGANYKLYLRDFESPEVGGYIGPNCPDQYFRFNFGVPIIKTMEFHLDAAVYGGRKPRLVTADRFRNDTGLQQTKKFIAKYVEKKSSQYEYTGGFKVSASYETSVTAGFPKFGLGASSKFTMSAETTHQWKQGTVEETTQEMTYESPLVVPPRSAIDGKLIIFNETGEVPYEMTVGFEGIKTTFKSQGKWFGVQSSQVELELKQSPL